MILKLRIRIYRAPPVEGCDYAMYALHLAMMADHNRNCEHIPWKETRYGWEDTDLYRLLIYPLPLCVRQSPKQGCVIGKWLRSRVSNLAGIAVDADITPRVILVWGRPRRRLILLRIFRDGRLCPRFGI